MVPIPTLPTKVVVESREVDEAKIPNCPHSGVVVAAVVVPKLVGLVKGYAKFA